MAAVSRSDRNYLVEVAELFPAVTASLEARIRAALETDARHCEDQGAGKAERVGRPKVGRQLSKVGTV
jgi:hypothetical protein